ncbi:family S53 protease-like protein [Mortierella sp. GBAus27b]|nr:hypothetical protein BGX31_002834 [Mortierella sp. GBA43]KAI8356354.1 family S53 protease-like protein [Mortierella sp. GBAus27b]
MAPITRTLIAISLVLQSVLAVPIQSAPTMSVKLGEYDTFETFNNIPEPWALEGPASPDEVLPFRIALKQQNLPEFEKRFYEISSPDHPDYGKFMTADEIHKMLDPAPESFDLVHSWLKAFGIEATQEHEWLKFDLPVSQAQVLLQTSFNLYRNDKEGTSTIATPTYSLPKGIHGLIGYVYPSTFVDPTVQPYGKIVMTKRQTNPSCNNQVTPLCLQSMYGIPTTRATQSRNTIAVPGFLNEFANKADLALLLSNYRKDLNPAPTFQETFIDGGRNDQNVPGVEANLDTQYTVGIASGVPVNFISVGRNDSMAFIDLSNYLLSQQTPPTVLAISYGFNENAISASFANQLCNSYMQLGSRGVSVIYASGDGGVAGSRPSNTCTRFVPTFPASCPYVTSVGATTGIQEVGAGLSAGGFSDIFAQPSYQASAVNSYLSALGGQYQGRFNPRGRGFPDVSAQGQHITIAYKGKAALVDGTSASAPIFGSIIALINDQLIAARRPPLGFLNPFLYSRGVGALNDIASGSNPSCGTSGFPARAGWDPVTGLGTPNFPKLKTAAGL